MSIRKIVFAGVDTLQSGIRINSERSETTGAEVSTVGETIPYRIGGIIYPTGRGSASLTYCLILHDEGGREAVKAKARALEDVFYGVKGDLLDSDITGKKYMNAVFVGSDPIEFVSRNFTTAYMTVHFKADPIPQNAAAVNERVLKFSANGGATITITDNSAYSITVGETTTTGTYTAAAPYKYRIVAVSENPITITKDGTAMTSDTFTLENATDDTTITISAAGGVTAIGYGYYELWHDTRAVST